MDFLEQTTNIHESLDLFGPPTTDYNIQKIHTEEFLPISQPTSNSTAISFNLEPSQYLSSLSSTILEFQYKITDAAGGKLKPCVAASGTTAAYYSCGNVQVIDWNLSIRHLRFEPVN